MDFIVQSWSSIKGISFIARCLIKYIISEYLGVVLLLGKMIKCLVNSILM